MDRRITILFFLPFLIMASDLGDHFAEKGYDFEAITEYKRQLYLSDNCNQDELLYKIGKIYQKADKDKQAEKYLLDGIFNEQKTDRDNQSLILLARIHWYNYDYAAFRNTLDYLGKRVGKQKTQDVQYILAWSYYYDANWKKGNQIINSLDLPFKNELLADISAVENVPQKSKQFALISSGILPGSGQLYAGDYENAVFSFLLVGSIGGSIIWNIIQKAYGIAVVKYLFLYTRYYRGGLNNLAHKIEKDNIDRIGYYLKKISQKYPDPIEKLENLTE